MQTRGLERISEKSSARSNRPHTFEFCVVSVKFGKCWQAHSAKRRSAAVFWRSFSLSLSAHLQLKPFIEFQTVCRYTAFQVVAKERKAVRGKCSRDGFKDMAPFAKCCKLLIKHGHEQWGNGEKKKCWMGTAAYQCTRSGEREKRNKEIQSKCFLLVNYLFFSITAGAQKRNKHVMPWIKMLVQGMSPLIRMFTAPGWTGELYVRLMGEIPTLQVVAQSQQIPLSSQCFS